MGIKAISMGLALALYFITGFTTTAYAGIWSATGSSFAVDESDVAEYWTSRGQLSFKSSVESGTVTGRHSISGPVIEGCGVGYSPSNVFRTLYSDSGADDQVYIRIMRWGIYGGYQTIMDFDSNDYPETGWQTREIPLNHDFDFENNAYFVEVWLHKFGSLGRAELGIVQIDSACAVD